MNQTNHLNDTQIASTQQKQQEIIEQLTRWIQRIHNQSCTTLEYLVALETVGKLQLMEQKVQIEPTVWDYISLGVVLKQIGMEQQEQEEAKEQQAE